MKNLTSAQSPFFNISYDEGSWQMTLQIRGKKSQKSRPNKETPVDAFSGSRPHICSLVYQRLAACVASIFDVDG